MEIPKAFGWVIASGALTGLTLFGLSSQVALARKTYSVPYPKLYADGPDAEKPESPGYKFNCAQRGHQNLLETYPYMLFLLTTGGLQHPVTAAALGLTWSVGAVGFYMGYATGDPKKRYSYGGGLIRLATMGLMAVAGSAAYHCLNKQG